MKKIFKISSVFLLVCTALTGFAQTPTWYWAKGAGLTGEDFGYSVALDNAGNSYATGSYTSATITFGSVTLMNAGGGDAFLVKYDAAGTVLWAKNIGSTAGEVGHAVAVDASGNCFVAGWFTSSTLPFVSTTLNATSGADIFIAKYDPAGTELWARSAGGSGTDLCNGLAVDPSGNVIAAGRFTGTTAVFGSTILTNTSAGTNDIFMAQYNGAGTLTWAINIGGANDELGECVETDGSGNIYLTGAFNSPSVSFGSQSVSNVGTATNMFIAKYDNSGNITWAKSAGGTGLESGYGVAVDKSGNVIVAGYFESPSVTIGSSTLTNAGYSDVFLVKYDATGTVLWASGAGGQYDDAGLSVAVDTIGEIYLTGKFSSTSITFGADVLTNNSAGTQDLFVVKYDAPGNALWTVRTGFNGDEIGSDIVVGQNGNVYVVGIFNSGYVSFGQTNVIKGCGNDFFIAVLNNNTVYIPEFSGISNLGAYPNPTSGNFYFSCDITNPRIDIFNEEGKLVRSEEHKGNISSYSMSGFPNGAYFVTITGTNKAIPFAGTYCGTIIVK